MFPVHFQPCRLLTLEIWMKHLNILKKPTKKRDTNVVLLKYEPWVPAILKNDPRFQKFLARVGYP